MRQTNIGIYYSGPELAENGSIKLPFILSQASGILEIYKGSRILCFHQIDDLKDNRFEHKRNKEQPL